MNLLKTRVSELVFCVLVVLFSAQTMQAQLSNLGQTSSGAGNVTADPGNGVHNLGQSFVTGSGLGIEKWSLSSITITMSLANMGTVSPFVLAIYSDNSNAPGALLTTFLGSDNPQTAGDYTYSVAGLLELDTATQYWIVASAVDSTASGSAYNWSIIDGNGTDFVTQEEGWTVNTGSAIGVYNGDAWAVFAVGDNGGNFAFAIDAAAVPEPGTVSLFLGAALIVSLRLLPVFRRNVKLAA